LVTQWTHGLGVPGQQACKTFDGLRLECWQDVAVDVHRDADTRVAQALGDDLRVHALLQQQGGVEHGLTEAELAGAPKGRQGADGAAVMAPAALATWPACGPSTVGLSDASRGDRPEVQT
jgi:hypothetical protein